MDFECNSATLLSFLFENQQFTNAWSALQFEGEGLEAPQRMRNGSVSTTGSNSNKAPQAQQAQASGCWLKFLAPELPWHKTSLLKLFACCARTATQSFQCLSHVLNISLLISGRSACSRHLDASWWTIHDESIVHARLGLQ